MKTRFPSIPLLAVFVTVLALSTAVARGDSSVRVSRLATATWGTLAETVNLWSPDGNYLVYAMDPAGDGGSELFSVHRTGSSPVRLSAEMPANENPSGMLVTADSSTVLFVAPNEIYQTDELYAVPLAGPALAAIRLHPPLSPGKRVRGALALTPDGSRVLFIADLDDTGHEELWSVPVDASELPQRLSSGAMVSGGNVEPPVKLSSDGATVVFRADAQLNGRLELWSAPADGSAPPVKLNPTLAAGSQVSKFEITIDDRVIFMADPTQGRQELWATPLAGPALAAIRLNAPLASSGDVTWFALVVDDTRVIYSADAGADEIFRLYGVSVDGSPAAVQVSTGMQANGSVVSWSVSSDDAFLVYRADSTSDEVYSLWSVTMDPLGSPVRLNPTFQAAGGDVTSFAISPDSRKVTYVGDLSTNNTPSLYVVNPDGTARRTLAHLAPDDDIWVTVTPDSLRAILRHNIPWSFGGATYSWMRIDGSDHAPVSLLPRGASQHFSSGYGVASPNGKSFAYRSGDGVVMGDLYVAQRSGPDLP